VCGLSAHTSHANDEGTGTKAELRGDGRPGRSYSGAVSHDDVVLGEGPDDSPWRPGSDARFEHPPRRAFAASAAPHPKDAPGDDRRAGHEPLVHGDSSGRPDRKPLAAVLATAVAVVAAVVIVAPGRGTAPTGAVEAAAMRAVDDAAVGARTRLVDLGGDVILGPGDVPLLTSTQCPASRLPKSVEPLWAADLLGTRRVVAPVTVTDDSVIAIVGFDPVTSDALPSVSVVAIGLDDGQERWRALLQPATGAHEIVGVADRTVIVRSAAGPDMAYRKLFGFDEESGAVLWERGFRGDWSATVEEATGEVYVGVRRPAVSSTGESEVEVLAPRTGDRLHIAAGAFVGTDPDGRLVTRVGDKVLASSVKDRDVLGVVDPTDSPFTVAGAQVVVADGDGTDLSVYAGSGTARSLPLVGSTGIDAPGFVVYLDSMGGSALLVNGDGAVHGAQVGDDSVEIRWRVSGVVLETAPTDRGLSLQVATEGGADQRVIDGSTGRTIVDLELRPGALQTLALVANGVVVQDYVDGDLARVALDLDGRELWSLPGSGPFAVGPGVVVDVDDADGFVRLAAWGEPLAMRDDATGCRSVMTEWIPR